jgi:hypothetical protein
MNYRKRYTSASGDFVIEEVRPDGRVRVVDQNQPDYIHWLALADSNIPEEIAYVPVEPPEPPSIEDVKAQKRAELMRARDQVLALGFTYGEYVYPLSDDVKLKMMIMSQAVQMGQTEQSYSWKDINEVYREIGDADAFQVFCSASLAYGLGLYAQEEALQALVNAAETVEEVWAVTWNVVV